MNNCKNFFPFTVKNFHFFCQPQSEEEKNLIQQTELSKSEELKLVKSAKKSRKKVSRREHKKSTECASRVKKSHLMLIWEIFFIYFFLVLSE